MINFLNILLIAGVLVSAPLYPKSEVYSLQTLEIWLKANIHYQAEKGDYWKTPEETVRDKGGDCEDMAFLNQRILIDLGYKAEAYWIVGYDNFTGKLRPYSHAICIFQDKGKFYYFSNQYYINHPFNTLDDLVTYDCSDWTWYSKIDLDHSRQALHKKWNPK
jgi:hypothetical protein